MEGGMEAEPERRRHKVWVMPPSFLCTSFSCSASAVCLGSWAGLLLQLSRCKSLLSNEMRGVSWLIGLRKALADGRKRVEVCTEGQPESRPLCATL